MIASLRKGSTPNVSVIENLASLLCFRELRLGSLGTALKAYPYKNHNLVTAL